ncbi:MAG: carbon-nitrogen hydrolase family protein [Chitinophagaceae bacterium]
MKIASATPTYPKDLDDGLLQVEKWAKEAAEKGAVIVCFPESYLPGYPFGGKHLVPCTPAALQQALQMVQAIARRYAIAIVLPMDAYIGGNVFNAAYVIDRQGTILGCQTKVQLDPSEGDLWTAGSGRQLFEIEGLRFGISICHEGFRYPETVRWAARQGAQVVFHPFYAGVDENGVRLKEWAQKEGPYYEKAQMSRALENTIYVATSNYAFNFPEAASSVIDPQGNCLAYQDYGSSGVIVEDIDLEKATGLLAARFKPIV